MHNDQMKFFRTTIVFPIIGLSIVAALIIVMVGSQQDQAFVWILYQYYLLI
jgi:hypothetical protein